MKLRWDLVRVEKSPACVGGGAPSCGAYSRKALRPPQQIKCGNAGVGSQCVDKKRPHRSGAKVCLFAEDGLPQRDNSERGDWFQKEKPRRSGARTNPGRNQDEDPVSNHANRGCFGASTAKRLIREANG